MNYEPIELKKAIEEMPSNSVFTKEMANESVKVLRSWFHSFSWKDKELARIMRKGNLYDKKLSKE